MAQPLDRGKQALYAFIRWATRDFVYHVQWGAKVVSQNDDGTLDVQPDSPVIPGMSNVPMRLGIPGFVVKVKSGARVLVGFQDGDPKKPIATLWDTSELDSISVTAQTKFSASAPTVELVPGGLAAARQGDMVALGGPSMIPVAVLITLTSPVPAPGAPGAAVVAPGTPISGLMTILTPTYGTITSGNPAVLE